MEAFLAAGARADEAEQRKIGADPDAGPFLLVTVFSGARLQASPTESGRYTSSWKVGDEDARLLMEALYRRLGSGVAPAAAAPHPCHWAAFTLWGLPE